jgi:hypothetical protein
MGGECSTFEIDVESGSIEDKLFDDDLKVALEKKFKLISNGEGERVCRIDVKLSSRKYSSGTDNSGNTNRKNNKINIIYSLAVEDKVMVVKNITVFYGSNVSRFNYSNHTKEKKEKSSNVDIISEKIFFDVVDIVF